MNVMYVTVYAGESVTSVNYEDIALDLKELGLFKGVSNTEFELDRAPSRVEAIIMLIRVLGKENEALNGDLEHSFIDVEDWANNYVGYAYNNGLSNGVSKTEFGSENASSAMYLTFVLRSLGYSDVDGNDFSWDSPYELARTIGILPDCVDTDNFMRKDVAVISYAALSVKLNGSEQTLAEKLISANVFTHEQFDSVYDLEKIVVANVGNVIDEDDNNENNFGELSQEAKNKILEATVDIHFYATDVEFRHGNPNYTCQGVIVAPEGIVATTYHAIEDSSVAVVELSNGLRYKVYSVLHYDKRKDIALLKLTSYDLETKKKVEVFPTIAYNVNYNIGDFVYALSKYYSDEELVKEFVSAEIVADNYGRDNVGYPYLQLSFDPLPWRYAGAPLFNSKGEIIGLLAAEGAGYDNENNNAAAIPAKHIEREHFAKKGTFYRDVYINELKGYLKDLRETENYVTYIESMPDEKEYSIATYIKEGELMRGTFASPENVDVYQFSVPTDFWLYADAVTLDPQSDDEINNKYFAEHGITYSEALTKTLKVEIRDAYTNNKVAELKCENKLYMGKVMAVLSIPKGVKLKTGTYRIYVSQSGEMYGSWKDREYLLDIFTYLID